MSVCDEQRFHQQCCTFLTCPPAVLATGCATFVLVAGIWAGVLNHLENVKKREQEVQRAVIEQALRASGHKRARAAQLSGHTQRHFAVPPPAKKDELFESQRAKARASIRASIRASSPEHTPRSHGDDELQPSAEVLKGVRRNDPRPAG